ncbi:hypothetical protein BE20_19885 [Sorangium cellulosum]|uniref:Uncharacterized protein n=1 Tax=Sorangium cellulosum TaxID=56 RepID=A0A150SBE2_SORCE|nr:hypothetical protein BE18_22070 [Sorangium cellulosum]KYF89697.1 hypothetical protein BE20_19885 [Sorangium cellulosum]
MSDPVRLFISAVPKDAALRDELDVCPLEQMLPALSDDVLRALSDAYLDSLSKETGAAIRARIGR